MVTALATTTWSQNNDFFTADHNSATQSLMITTRAEGSAIQCLDRACWPSLQLSQGVKMGFWILFRLIMKMNEMIYLDMHIFQRKLQENF